MVKLSPQQCFDKACAEYDKAKAIIADLTAAAKEISKDFNGEIAMRQFDMTVQAILLNVAVADGSFDELEKVFIKNITDYADILNVVNADMKKSSPDWIDITWEHIGSLKPEYQEKFAAICAASIEKYANEFTYFFSAIDVIDDRDYLGELRNCLFGMLLMLDAVNEGGFDPAAEADQEQIRGLNVYSILFDKNWANNTETFKKALEENG